MSHEPQDWYQHLSGCDDPDEPEDERDDEPEEDNEEPEPHSWFVPRPATEKET